MKGDGWKRPSSSLKTAGGGETVRQWLWIKMLGTCQEADWNDPSLHRGLGPGRGVSCGPLEKAACHRILRGQQIYAVPPSSCHCYCTSNSSFILATDFLPFLGIYINLSDVLDAHSESSSASLVWSFQADLNHVSSQGHSCLFMSNRPPEHRAMPLSFRLDL